MTMRPVHLPIRPPAGFFQSKTLVVLKLRVGAFSFESNESVSFPNLKVLNLDRLQIFTKSTILRFSDEGYPLLENLSLKELRHSYRQTTIEIFSQTLSRLTVNNLPPSMMIVVADTPHVQHLNCNIGTRSISLKKCETLESAVLSINEPGFDKQAFTETLKNVTNVKDLRVVLNTAPEAFIDDDHPLPSFPNLEKLGFEHVPSAASKELLWHLLHHAPNLTWLEFNMDEFGEYMLPSKIVPPCLGQNLREIRLESFEWTEDEVTLVEWLLKQGTKLQEILIDSEQNNVKIAAMNRLVKMGKRYPKCEFVFVGEDDEEELY